MHARNRHQHSVLPLGEDAEGGARLTRIVENGPAQKAGLQLDDVVLQLNDKEVKNYRGFIEMLGEFAVIGKRDEVPGLLRAKYEGVLDRVSLYMPFVPGTDDDWWQEVVNAMHG